MSFLQNSNSSSDSNNNSSTEDWRKDLPAIFQHAKLCWGARAGCSRPGCNEMTQTFQHMDNCKDPNCKELSCKAANTSMSNQQQSQQPTSSGFSSSQGSSDNNTVDDKMSSPSTQPAWMNQLPEVFNHAKLCYAGQQCTRPGCREMSSTFLHMENCRDRNCTEISCQTANRITNEVWDNFMNVYR